VGGIDRTGGLLGPLTGGENMKRFFTILALVILLPTAAMAGEPRTLIDEATVKWVAAFNAGDAATVASLYSEDAALFPPGAERVDGRSAIQTFWQGAIDSGMKADDLHAVEVEARSDMAGEIGVFTLSVPGDNGRTKIAGKYIVIWKHSGDTWQLHRDIWNTN
jgi:ketosteroid isomerase-like protein